jgi:phosphate-selective porin OprO/OprP
MKSIQSAVRTALYTALTAVSLTASLPAQTASASDLEALREQIRLLDQKLKVLERNSELRDEAAVAAAKKQPKLNVGDGRVEVVSADGANSLRLRALVQADARLYLDSANAAQDGFVLRRARLIFEGKFNDNVQYTVQPEFAGSTVSILDANINTVVTPGFQVRVGRFKTPIGLEQLQSDPVAFFNERSIATNLTPNRDVGIQVHGDVLEKRLNYAVGVFNGVLENGNSPAASTNTEGDFTTVGRLFATPFVNDKDSALKGLGFGLAAGTGNYTGAAPGIAYRTDGQQTFFAYDTTTGSTTQSAGRSLTVSPQAYYYTGPLGILAEYVSATSELARGTNSREITNTAYNLSVGYVLTGEDSSYTGVTPKETFKPSADTWGAFEVVGRVAQLDVDNDVFTGGTPLASSTGTSANATKVTALGAGLNWYLSKAVRANFDVTQNQFDFQGARPTTGVLSDDELVFSTRVQVSF